MSGGASGQSGLTGLSQAEYEETPYADASWEVVGEPPAQVEFAPLELAIVRRETRRIDPMFADFNTSSAKEEGTVWHCPTGEFAPAEEDEASATAVGVPEDEVKAREDAAFQRGREEAIAEAASRYAERVEETTQRIQQILQDVSEQHQTALLEYERQAVELALAISHKLFGTAVEICPEYIVEVVQSALKSVGGAAIKKIRVSPGDYEFIQMEGVSQQMKEFDGTWQFESDETVRAGCILETSAGQVDMQLDAAWERVQDRVMKVVR